MAVPAVAVAPAMPRNHSGQSGHECLLRMHFMWEVEKPLINGHGHQLVGVSIGVVSGSQNVVTIYLGQVGHNLVRCQVLRDEALHRDHTFFLHDSRRYRATGPP